MQTAPQPDPGALVLVPVSPALAQLLHALQGQILLEAAAGAPQLQPGACVIPPRKGEPKLRWHSFDDRHGYRSYRGTDDDFCSISLQTPLCGDPEWPSQRPGVWYGSEERRDTSGRKWRSQFPHQFVTDDFGTLVPLGGAQ